MNRRNDASARPDDTRRAILEAARDLFMTQGYRAVSTRQVADACGLTQPALYYHFGGKQDLYVAVLLDQLDGYRRALTTIASSDGSARVRLRRAIGALLQRSDVDHGQMFHDIRWELSVERQREVRVAFERSMVEPLIDILDRAARDGLIDSGQSLMLPPPVMAMHLMGIVRFAIESMGFWKDESGSAGSVTTWASVVERLFLDGVGPRT